MFKKVLSVVLVGFLLNVTGVSFAYAGSKEEKETRFAEKVKEGIGKLGTGAEARIEVKLRDKTNKLIMRSRRRQFFLGDGKTVHRSVPTQG